MKEGNLKKKVSDFIKLENGQIGKKAAVVTGAILTASAISSLIAAPVKAENHCDC